VECRVEHGHLRHALAQHFAHGKNSFDVARVVQWSKVDAALDAFQHFVGDQRRFMKQLAAMNHAVAHGVDIGRAANLRHAGFIGHSPANHVIERRGSIAQGCRQFLRGTVGGLQRKDGFAADVLHFAAHQSLIGVFLDAFGIGRDHLKLQTGTSRVQNKDVHTISFHSAIAHGRTGEMKPSAGAPRHTSAANGDFATRQLAIMLSSLEYISVYRQEWVFCEQRQNFCA